jgi:hypothetical protein
MFKCLISTASAGWCRSAFPYSLFNLVRYFHSKRIWPEEDFQVLDFNIYEGSWISHQREKTILDALKEDWSHVLFIDDDMGFNPDTLHRLAGRRVPLVGCNYRKRRPPAEFLAKRNGKIIETTDETSGLEPVDFMGFGFFLAEMNVFRNIPQPWFDSQWQGGGDYSTEDAYFMTKARDHGYEVLLDHDTSKLIWHNGNVAYTYKDDFTNINKIFKTA